MVDVELPKGWSIQPLKKLCQIVMGQSPLSSTYNADHIGVPLIQGLADTTDGLTTPKVWTSEPTKVVPASTTLMSVRAPVGSVVRSDTEVNLGRGMCGFLPYSMEIGNFLYHSLVFSEQAWSSTSQGSTFTAVNKANVEEFLIALPDDPREQQIIAEALSDIDELITVVKANIVKIQNVKQGLIHQIFSNLARSEKLKDYAFLASGGTPLTSVKSYYGGEIAWASISDMTHSGKYIESTDRKLTESGLKNSAAHIYPDNTLLFAMYASIGKCAIPTVPIASSQAILGITCKSGLLCNFLYHFLTFIQPELIAFGQQGTQSNLNKIIVGNILIPLLSEDEQKNIAAKLDLFDEILDSDKKELSKLERLKRAMMHDLLTGKVRLV